MEWFAGTAALQAEANAWRKVEGVMGDKRISQKLKGDMLSSCIIPAYLYGIDHGNASKTTRETESLRE